jgi:uncharacterized protein (TIGR03435 family)
LAKNGRTRRSPRRGLDRLNGAYDFDLPIAWESAIAGGKVEACGGGSSVFAALKALGLVLEQQKQVQEFVVVDSVLRNPVPN